MAQLQTKTREYTLMQFETWEVLTAKEKEERRKLNPKNLCSFGISVLDDAMYKIFPDDLIIIGADSGMGKSSLVLNIAQHNAEQGKIVALFFLEGGHNEAIRRIKWRMICDEYYRTHEPHTYVDMDYILWRANDASMEALKPIEEMVDEKLKTLFKENFFIYNINPDVYAENQRVDYSQIYKGLVDFFDGSEWGKIKYKLDLLIIDHLHYFDLEDGSRSTEADKLSKAMRMCKEISDIHKIPIILVSHLRKKGKDRGLPDQEDFHGSSNIPKISTDSIVIAPSYALQDNAHLIYPTYFRFTKSRRGLKSNYAALVNYDLQKNTYQKDYKIYPVGILGTVTDGEELPPHKNPKWVKRHNRKEQEEVKKDKQPESVNWDGEENGQKS